MFARERIISGLAGFVWLIVGSDAMLSSSGLVWQAATNSRTVDVRQALLYACHAWGRE